MGKPGKVKVKNWFRAEVWQDDALVACVEGADAEGVGREIMHYAAQYAEDGPVVIKHPKVGRR